MRTKTSCAMPDPSKDGMRVLTKIRKGHGSSSAAVAGFLSPPGNRSSFEYFGSKMNHLASSTRQTSSRQISTFRWVSIRPRSSFIPSSSPPWNLLRLLARWVAVIELVADRLSLSPSFPSSRLPKLDSLPDPVLFGALPCPPPLGLDVPKLPDPSSSSSPLESFERSCSCISSYSLRTSFSVRGVRPSCIHAIPSEKRSRTSTVWIAATASVVLPFPALSECREVMEVMNVGVLSSPSMSRGPALLSSKLLTTCFISLWR
mmetsp:Transcript_31557/g.94429  ORF Transcript_31557/g.94429 Transcript_31557/m.94429 type:complete len:260 (-) Transcript_31557:1062-1841(-)